MQQAIPQSVHTLRENREAVGLTAGVFGIYAGVLGIEHGFFETLQGNVAPAHLKIFAVSPWELPFPFGHEPAMTVILNFLVTGVAAMLCGLAIILWSTRFLHGRRGGAVLSLLSVILLLVGGGFGPISLLVIACIAASRIGKPLKLWRALIPPGLRRALARTWSWWLVASLLWVPAEFVAGQIFHVSNDHRQSLTNLNLLLSYPMLMLFVLTLIAGLAREIEKREGHRDSMELTASRDRSA
jgi:hypothetical protein